MFKLDLEFYILPSTRLVLYKKVELYLELVILELFS